MLGSSFVIGNFETVFYVVVEDSGSIAYKNIGLIRCFFLLLVAISKHFASMSRISIGDVFALIAKNSFCMIKLNVKFENMRFFENTLMLIFFVNIL